VAHAEHGVVGRLAPATIRQRARAEDLVQELACAEPRLVLRFVADRRAVVPPNTRRYLR
jgi:hypothetical protein